MRVCNTKQSKKKRNKKLVIAKKAQPKNIESVNWNVCLFSWASIFCFFFPVLLHYLLVLTLFSSMCINLFQYHFLFFRCYYYHHISVSTWLFKCFVNEYIVFLMWIVMIQTIIITSIWWDFVSLQLFFC